MATGRGGVADLTESVSSQRLHVVDTSRDGFFEYDSDVNLTDNYKLGFGNNAPRRIATHSNGHRWVIDDDRAESTGGIATYGNHLWIVDRGTDRVYYFEDGAGRNSGSTSATSDFMLTSGNTNPRGIYSDGNSLWVVNIAGSKDRVDVYDTTGSIEGY